MALQLKIKYDPVIEHAIEDISLYLKSEYNISKRAVALLLLQEDEDMLLKVRRTEGTSFTKISEHIKKVQLAYDKPLSYMIALSRQKATEEVVQKTVSTRTKKTSAIAHWMNRITMNPITGFPFLVLVLYFGLYKIVGQLGAGTIVDFLETNIFEKHVNPWINEVVATTIPWGWLQDLLANEYGIITLGIRYAVAIVLPIVFTFFIVFSIIEDSGYLPRLAMLVDRIFKKIGLNGRAVIPMTLGFGCTTMATMVSRTLETKRERVIATLLLALAIPCSAQLGVIMALLSTNPTALVLWILFMVTVFLLVGFLSSRILPDKKPTFYMEVPPLRLPKVRDVLVKTYTRMHWYFIEILPLFILASVIIWFGNLTGLFGWVVDGLKPLVHLIGLPEQTAEIFLFGFFRRDYGAAGLFELFKDDLLSTRQMLVAAATLTLFVPCIAQFAMMIKERGLKTAFAIGAFIFPFAFTCGFVLNQLILLLGVF